MGKILLISYRPEYCDDSRGFSYSSDPEPEDIQIVAIDDLDDYSLLNNLVYLERLESGYNDWKHFLVAQDNDVENSAIYGYTISSFFDGDWKDKEENLPERIREKVFQSISDAREAEKLKDEEERVARLLKDKERVEAQEKAYLKQLLEKYPEAAQCKT